MFCTTTFLCGPSQARNRSESPSVAYFQVVAQLKEPSYPPGLCESALLNAVHLVDVVGHLPRFCGFGLGATHHQAAISAA